MEEYWREFQEEAGTQAEEAAAEAAVVNLIALPPSILAGHVSALRSHWETQAASGSSSIAAAAAAASSLRQQQLAQLEELRRRLDKNGKWEVPEGMSSGHIAHH